MARRRKTAAKPPAQPESSETSGKEQQERMITPDSGLPHTLAQLKLGSWLPGKEKIDTVIPMLDDEAKISKDRPEDGPESSNAVRKLSFVTPPVGCNSATASKKSSDCR
ncbi:hypothetical protein P3L10_030256 [Capsicum annuum]